MQKLAHFFTEMKKEKIGKKTRRTSIGGQAVLEGVMMRSDKSMAIAVRAEDGSIVMETTRLTPLSQKSVFYRIPFIRGVLNFFVMLFMGMNITMRSGAVFDMDSEPSKLDSWVAKKLKVSPMHVAMVIGVILGLRISICLFVIIPQTVISTMPSSVDGINVHAYAFLKNLLEGLLRMFIFVMYLVSVSQMKDIKRIFKYHGAEHKTISCYEHEKELTVENVQKMSTIHDRCGTTFMFIVMVLGILVVSITGWQEFAQYSKAINVLIRIVVRLALMPVVAGVSYEVLKFLAKFDNPFINIIKAPGLLLQKITTNQPDDDMVECAIAAFKKVQEMDNDPTLKEEKFNTKIAYLKSREEIKNIAKCDDSDIDWMYVSVLKINRDDLVNLSFIRENDFDNLKALAKRRAKGEPLQQILGDTSFYGYDIKVNKSVLCPRFETEFLVYRALKIINDNNFNSVLDMCTGSGAIAIALKKERKDLNVAASDISEYALLTAKENARSNNANITFILSDLFDKIKDDFDVIVSNPPYILSSDIDNLDVEVKNYEPKLALDGGEDGLDIYRKIRNSISSFKKLRYLILEIGINQKDQIYEIFKDYDVSFEKDLNNIDRIVIIKVVER